MCSSAISRTRFERIKKMYPITDNYDNDNQACR